MTHLPIDRDFAAFQPGSLVIDKRAAQRLLGRVLSTHGNRTCVRWETNEDGFHDTADLAYAVDFAPITHVTAEGVAVGVEPDFTEPGDAGAYIG